MKSKGQQEHIPIMVKEALFYFADSKIGTFFEGTVGGGGHAKAILEAHPEIKRYMGCDADPEALEIAKHTLAPWKDKVELIHGNFSQLDQYLNERKIKTVDGFFLT